MAYSDDIDIEKSGKDIMIGFNPRFVMDVLKVIDSDEISMYMVNPKSNPFANVANNSAGTASPPKANSAATPFNAAATACSSVVSTLSEHSPNGSR